MSDISTTSRGWVTGKIRDLRETAPVQANNWSDVRKLDRLITIGMELAKTGGHIVVMVPNADLCSTIANCIRLARPNSFWGFASQRVIDIQYDVAAMAQAIEDARRWLPADALIVVRFFSHLGQPMKWPVFAISDEMRPIVFIGSGVTGHSGTRETYDTCLHKNSMIGSLQLAKWSPGDSKYRGIGYYGLGTHQSAAQATLEYTSDFFRLAVFFAAWPILAGAAGVANYCSQSSATTMAVKGLRDRVIRQSDVLNLVSLPAGSDFINISAARLLELHHESRSPDTGTCWPTRSIATRESSDDPSEALSDGSSSMSSEFPPRPPHILGPAPGFQRVPRMPLSIRIKFLMYGRCKCAPATCLCPASGDWHSARMRGAAGRLNSRRSV